MIIQDLPYAFISGEYLEGALKWLGVTDQVGAVAFKTIINFTVALLIATPLFFTGMIWLSCLTVCVVIGVAVATGVIAAKANEN